MGGVESVGASALAITFLPQPAISVALNGFRVGGK